MPLLDPPAIQRVSSQSYNDRLQREGRQFASNRTGEEKWYERNQVAFKAEQLLRKLQCYGFGRDAVSQRRIERMRRAYCLSYTIVMERGLASSLVPPGHGGGRLAIRRNYILSGHAVLSIGLFCGVGESVGVDPLERDGVIRCSGAGDFAGESSCAISCRVCPAHPGGGEGAGGKTVSFDCANGSPAIRWRPSLVRGQAVRARSIFSV